MRVFLSYSDPDRAVALRLHEGLRHRRPDLDLYLAPVRNRLGAYWIPRLAEELAAADAVLLLMGDRVGTWQELEYAEAVRLNRNTRRPLIAPILLGDAVPGLPFIDQFHRLVFDPSVFDHVLDGILAALDGSVAPDAAPLWRLTNPYRGLPAMRSEDAAYFFGREAITAEILDTLRLKPDRIIALVGNSGVGKSSIAQAGVLAALRSRLWPGDPDRAWPAALADSPAWLPVTIIPGERPLKALALGFARTWLDDPADAEAQAIKWVDLLAAASDLAALADAARSQVAERTAADPPPRVLLYVDQAEELYARAEPGEAEAVSRLLADAVRRPEILVLSSLRSDYYGRFQNDGPLFAASDRLDVPPLDREQIDRIIRGPAARLGVRFDRPEIVPLIAQATARAPGSMPMLSYLMADAWEAMRRDQASGGVLSFAYEIVDISRPLADRADRFLARHPDSETALRRLFTLKLTHMPKEGEPVRRRAGRQDCTAEEWSLAEQLAGPDWRLLTTGRDGSEATVEVSHEALLRNWPRLVLWLDGAREFLIWKGQFEADRRIWEAALASDKQRALLTGLRLDAACFWLAERPADLGEAERSFIQTSSRVAREAEAAHEETRKRIARRTFTGMVLISVVAVIALGLALNGEEQRQRAENEQLIAEVERQRSEAALEIAEREHRRAEAELRRAQIEQARSRAATARDLVASGQSAAALEVALTVMPQSNPHGWPEVNQIREVPIALVDAISSLREELNLRGHEDEVTSAVFWPDGRSVLTASFDSTVRLWDATDGRQIEIIRGLDTDGQITLSPDNRRVLVTARDGTAHVRDVAEGERTVVLRGHEDLIVTAEFSPSGTRIVTASLDNSARVWDASDGSELAVLRAQDGFVRYTYLDDGRRIEVESESPTLDYLVGSIRSASFSPDGHRIVTSSDDMTARVWDTATGREITVLLGHEDSVVSAAFSSDGGRIVTTSTDATVRIWDANDGQQLLVLPHQNDEYYVSMPVVRFTSSTTISHSTERIVTTFQTRAAYLWNAGTGTQIAILHGHEDLIHSVEFSPDGSRIVTASSDNTARLWDAVDGHEIAVLRAHRGRVYSASFSSDGRRIVTASADGTARLWNATDGAEIFLLRGRENRIASAAFSPNGNFLVTGSRDGRVQLWSMQDGGQIAEMGTHEHAVRFSAFSSDGARIATVAVDGTARVWDVVSGTQINSLNGYPGIELGFVSSVAFSPDVSRIVIMYSSLNVAQLWDVSGLSPNIALHSHGSRVRSAVFSPDASRIMTTSWSAAHIWNAINGRELIALQTSGNLITSAVFSPANDKVFIAREGGDSRILSSIDGQVFASFSASSDYITSAVFSPDGSRIVTTGWDRTVGIWNAADGTNIATMRGHQRPVMVSAYSPDGECIATGAADGTVRLWDAMDGTNIAILRGHEDGVRAVAFSTDGTAVLTISGDGSARVWPRFRTMNELFDRAQGIVSRLQPLTHAERCAHYLITEECDDP